jgi:hypothetical protein
MKKLASVLPAIAIVASAAIAGAGVVVDEQQIVDQPNGSKVTRARTVMIEGDKQKSIINNGNQNLITVITDLGKGTMIVVDGTHKTYTEIPFPPKGGGMAAMQAGMSPTISFKKTGGHDKIIGYPCDEYSGAGTVGGNSVRISGCFSDSAPGAADYSNFQHEMADKVKGTGMANMWQIPQGVPLRLTINTALGNTNTTVSGISTKSLPADSFQAPLGYQKQQPPPMLGGMGRGAPMTPAPNKVPE